jgi:hypothetical protein
MMEAIMTEDQDRQRLHEDLEGAKKCLDHFLGLPPFLGDDDPEERVSVAQRRAFAIEDVRIRIRELEEELGELNGEGEPQWWTR